MAIYGVGARINNNQVEDEFFINGYVGTGWSSVDAPDLHSMFESLEIGDIIYLKRATHNTSITVLGIGVIIDSDVIVNHLIAVGRNVKWIDRISFTIDRPLNGKNNVRNNTIYQEFHPDIVDKIMARINLTLI